MGYVETIYTIVTNTLDGVAEAQFGQLAASIGLTGQLLAAVMTVLVLINMSMQTVPASKETSLIFLVKMVLIALFLQNWSQFNLFASAILSMFDSVAGALISSVSTATGDTLAGPLSFAIAFDQLMDQMKDYMNVTAGRMNILGSVINGLMWLLMGLFSAVAALLMMGSRIVITLLLGVAPLAILSTLTPITKSFFERWLSAVVAMALYPVVIAGVFATIIGIMKAVIEGIGSAESIQTLGAVTPIIAILIMSTLMAGMIPTIVGSISGQIGLKDMVTGGLARAAGRITGAAAGAAGGAAMRGTSTVVKDTASYMKNPVQNTRQQVDSRAAQINRASERIARLRRK